MLVSTSTNRLHGSWQRVSRMSQPRKMIVQGNEDNELPGLDMSTWPINQSFNTSILYCLEWHGKPYCTRVVQETRPLFPSLFLITRRRPISSCRIAVSALSPLNLLAFKQSDLTSFITNGDARDFFPFRC